MCASWWIDLAEWLPSQHFHCTYKETETPTRCLAEVWVHDGSDKSLKQVSWSQSVCSGPVCCHTFGEFHTWASISQMKTSVSHRCTHRGDECAKLFPLRYISKVSHLWRFWRPHLITVKMPGAYCSYCVLVPVTVLSCCGYSINNYSWALWPMRSSGMALGGHTCFFSSDILYQSVPEKTKPSSKAFPL